MASTVSGTKNGLCFINEDENEIAFFRFFPCGREDFSHLSFGLSQPHVQNLRTVDIHEVFLHVLAGAFVVLTGQVVRRRFANQCLAASRRAVQQNSLERSFAEFLIQFGINQWQFDGVPDNSDNLFLSTDFFPGKSA